MKRGDISLVVCLTITIAYFEARVDALKRDVYRAQSAAQSGLLSVQRACKPIIEMVRSAEPGTPGLIALSFGCLGSTNGEHEYAEYDSITDSGDPELLAAFIERRLHQQRRLPWRTIDPVDPQLLPAMVFDGSWIP